MSSPNSYANSGTATSPPYPPHPQLPSLSINTMSKRRAVDAANPVHGHKRRKASGVSATSATSAHPLRQTSFPPDDGGGVTAYSDARSPSAEVDNMSFVSGSQISGLAGPARTGRKRGRKSKAEKAAAVRERTPSLAGGRANTAVSGGRGSIAAGQEPDDEEDDGPTETAAAAAGELTAEQKEQQHQRKGMLFDVMNDDQRARYFQFRAAKLVKGQTRKLINATISQSVGESIVLSVGAMSKIFLGDIISAARRVQGEWIEKTGEVQSTEPLPTPPANRATAAAGETASTTPAEAPRGPLRPDHLREALRRYRKGLEGGGVGMTNLWQQQRRGGVERFPTRTGGRRIFR